MFETQCGQELRRPQRGVWLLVGKGLGQVWRKVYEVDWCSTARSGLKIFQRHDHGLIRRELIPGSAEQSGPARVQIRLAGGNRWMEITSGRRKPA